MSIKSGFLIVKTFSRLYQDYVVRYNLARECYAMPRIDKRPEDYKIQYRGLYRDALSPSYGETDILAEVRMAEMETEGKCDDGFLFELKEVQDVLEFIDNQLDFEVIWTRTVQSNAIPPQGYCSIGYEPSYFDGGHFSASCDCMLFPRWHGTDREGTLFLGHYRKLNQHGMFSSREEASEFLDYYLSFDWTETYGDYKIAEVFVPLSAL